jgi:hypothetical protein
MFPNPAQDQLYLDHLPAAASVSLLTPQGQLIRSYDQVANRQALSLQGLPAGMYLLQVEADGQTWREKLLKQ